MTSPVDINLAIVNALGIPIKDLISATIVLRAGEFPRVRAICLVNPPTIDDLGEVAKEIRRFDLVPRDGAGS